MINAVFRPVDSWPGKPTADHNRKGNAFGHASYASTLDFLERELAHLKAQNIIIQAYFRSDQIRNDGWPKGGAGAEVGSAEKAIEHVCHPSIVCPQCGKRSYHPEDVKQAYCGNCHQFHADMQPEAKRPMR